MSWFGVLDKLLALLLGFFRSKAQRDTRQEGVELSNQAHEKEMEKRNDDAEKARDALKSEPPERLRESDGFRRD